MLVNQQALQGITTGFKTIFNKVFNETKTHWEGIATRVPSETGEESYKWLGKIPRMREWIGDREIQNLTGSEYTIKNKDFESTIAVNRNDVADDKIGVYKPLIQDMAQMVKRHPDDLVFSLLGKGFITPCYDGKMFFATDHTFDNKKTQSNKGTKKLSPTAYAGARAQMMTIKGENGKSLKIVPDTLVVAPQNEAVARQILFAELINGETNVNKGTAELLVIPELADYPDQWYLACTKRAIKPLVYQEREKPKFVSLDKDLSLIHI